MAPIQTTVPADNKTSVAAGASPKITIVLTGSVRNPQFIIAQEFIQALVSQNDSAFEKNFTSVPMCDMDFIYSRHQKKKEINLPDRLYHTLFIKVDIPQDKKVTTQYFNIESLSKWAKQKFDFNFFTEKPEEKYITEASHAFSNLLSTISNPKVYMNVSIDGIGAGKLVFELFQDLCPKAVEQFLSFVRTQTAEGPSYRGTQFTRLVEDGWIQGGDIRDEAGYLVQEPVIADENFIVKHNRRGTLSFVNQGPNSSCCAFMVLLASSMAYFDRKYVAFGRLIEGEETLQNMECTETRFERPTRPIKISDIGMI